MNALKKNYRLKLNSVNKIEELLQELYNETNKMVNEIQEQMNKLSSSVSLNQEPMDAKAKYSKSMNDFLANKEKAISRKLDIAKLMSEILKYNGNMKAVIQESDLNWDNFKDTLVDTEGDTNNSDKPIEYEFNSK
jgi:methyl-accepting chemotaxis protein